MHTRTGAVQEHDVHSLRIVGLVAAISSFFGYGRCACRPVQRHAVRDNQDYTMDTLDLRAGKLPGSIEFFSAYPDRPHWPPNIEAYVHAYVFHANTGVEFLGIEERENRRRLGFASLLHRGDRATILST